MLTSEITKQAARRYHCKRCGYETIQVTNHRGSTWSWGHVNCCPVCPPWAKYPEFGGQTIWEYVEDVTQAKPTWKEVSQA